MIHSILVRINSVNSEDEKINVETVNVHSAYLGIHSQTHRIDEPEAITLTEAPFGIHHAFGCHSTRYKSDNLHFFWRSQQHEKVVEKTNRDILRYHLPANVLPYLLNVELRLMFFSTSCIDIADGDCGINASLNSIQWPWCVGNWNEMRTQHRITVNANETNVGFIQLCKLYTHPDHHGQASKASQQL